MVGQNDLPQRSTRPFAELLHDRAEISGRTIEEMQFVRVLARRASIVDSLLRGCTFDDCSFTRSDFEAVAFENCTFSGCDFSTADFRSCEFSNCKLVNCRFPGGAFIGVTMRGCLVVAARFDRQMLDGNTWTECEFTRVRFHRATLIHSTFTSCHFGDTRLDDCASMYHFFERCSFTSCRMNVETVALSQGLTRDNLASLTLVWQGLRQRTPADIDDLLRQLSDALVSRVWAVAACSLAINFSLGNTRDAFRLAYGAIAKTINAGRPIRREEVRYLARLADRLSTSDRLPFFVVVDGLELLGVDGAGEALDDESYRLLAFALKEAEYRAVRGWEAAWSKLQDAGEDPLLVEFIFDERPSVELLPVLQELARARGELGSLPESMGTRRGSYVEAIALGLGTLTAFVISLGMLVRGVDALITLRAKLEILVAPRLPSQVRTRALQRLPSGSAEMMREIAGCLALLSAGKLPSLASGSEELVDRLQGISVLGPTPHRSRVRGGAGEAKIGIADRSEGG